MWLRLFNKVSFFAFLILLVSLYFVYHTINGNFGYNSLLNLQDKYEILNNKYEDIKIERSLLENKVNNMNPSSLDLDLSEQMIKEVLGMTDPKEQIIIIKKKKNEKHK